MSFTKFEEDILEFLTKDTLEAIDWGVLDLGHIKDMELKSVLMRIERSLTLELMDNYKNNDTGIFRVSYCNGVWCYDEHGFRVKAKSLDELKLIIEGQNRIWYVFDEYSLRR